MSLVPYFTLAVQNGGRLTVWGLPLDQCGLAARYGVDGDWPPRDRIPLVASEDC